MTRLDDGAGQEHISVESAPGQFATALLGDSGQEVTLEHCGGSLSVSRAPQGDVYAEMNAAGTNSRLHVQRPRL